MSYKLTISILLCYALGGIPIGIILSKKFKRIDIRNFGSHNIGATNVFRHAGKFEGILTGIVDGLKPVLAMTIFKKIDILPASVIPLLGASAVCGDLWSIFLKFKGGRGLAATIGYFAYLMPDTFIIAFPIAVFIAFITKWNFPVGGLSMYIISPIIGAKMFHYSPYVIIPTLYLGLLMLIREFPWMTIHLINYFKRRSDEKG